jgi:uncharacterized protein
MDDRPLAVKSSRSIGVFLAVAFAWTWVFEFVGRSRQTGEPRVEQLGVWLLVASFGPTVGAFVAAAREGGVRTLLRRFGPLRQRWATMLLAGYVLVPAAVVSAVVFSGGQVAKALSETGLLVFIPLVGLFSIIGGPLGEEFGWRGVLLPWMLQRWSALTSSIVVGVVWAVWHAPLWTFPDFIPGLRPIQSVPLYIVSLVGYAIIMTMLSIRSCGSVAIAMLAHGVFNSVLLPFDSLREKGALTVAPAWPFALAVVVTASLVVLAGGLRTTRRQV